jgi:hypothetical protein
MDRPKVVAIVTGILSLLLAIGYLVLVQILDFRGDMVPAPALVLRLMDFPKMGLTLLAQPFG